MALNPTDPSPNTASPIPKPLLIGLGCPKKTAISDIMTGLQAVLSLYKAYPHAIAVPEFKYHDPNMIQLQDAIPCPLIFIPQATLEKLQPQCQSFSETAYRHTGLGSVAEACLRAIMDQKDHLLIPKIIYNGISLAVAYKHFGI